MNNQYLISVIIPVYNSENTLDRCLGSIINQTYKNLEIIIINDGSKDNSLEKIKEYQNKDSRIVFFSQENHGVSNARNQGLKHVHGDFVQFVDADDDLDLDYFRQQLDLIIKNDADMAICNNDHPFFYTTFTDRVYDMTKKEDFLEFYQHTFAATLPWNKLIRAAAVKDVHFVEEVSFCEDELFFCSIAKNIKKIVSNSKVLYHYYIAKSDDNNSAIVNIVKSSKFWENKSSFYYKGLLCIPFRREYFQDAIDKKEIPFDDVNELLYRRVFDFTFYQYAVYAGFNIPEECMCQEMINIFTDKNFIASVKDQERYGLRFIDFNSDDYIEKVKKLNHYIYTSYQDIYSNHLDLHATICAISIFVKMFVEDIKDVNSVNWLNKLEKALINNSTNEAKYVNKLFSSK